MLLVSSMASPPQGPKSPSTPMSKRSRASSGLSLDLSDLPPLITPSPPSNTLLITNLDHPEIFSAPNLQTIRDLIAQHANIYSFSPLKSFRRIIVTFTDIPSAQTIKQNLDDETIFNCRVRVYFGAQTDISPTQQHLKAPDAGKLYFISPPPSPPQGWELKNEDPPNKEVIAEDLAAALAKLHAKNSYPVSADMENDIEAMNTSPTSATASATGAWKPRSRSHTLVYHPEHHGSNPLLPAISVEDTTTSEEQDDSPAAASPMEDVRGSGPILHTSRPPVELMEQ